ncbi:MAG: hypothetical protein C4576_25370 [Desulfobacteraceae bacterium]|nr:MAG: hypothetical protein C4576_25370 [Desulfobacteraceae bacterium]
MNKKPKGRRFPWLIVAVVVCLSLAAGYYFGTKRAVEVSPPAPVGQSSAGRPPVAQTDAAPPVTGERIHIGKIDETSRFPRGDECRKVQEDVKDFFKYLDKKPYVRQIDPEIDTYQWFNRIMTRLTSRLPVPAGENLDSVAMANHIFYFFRNLEPKELRLLREVMVNESSTLEANMDLFFRWLSLGESCSETGGFRAPPEALYCYAGFFLNTIGGRAYLFRNSPGVRWLVTYYSTLVIHDADKRGKNSYGIDVVPHLKSLTQEMGFHKDFLFQKEYGKKLGDLEEFYRGR